MPDLRDDTTDDGFHEIQFSSKQLVFLFMAASVVLIFVFLAGVLVGRDTTSRPTEASIASGATSEPERSGPPPEDQKPNPADPGPPAGPDTLTYDRSLSDKKGDPAPAPIVETQAPPQPAAASQNPPVATPEPVAAAKPEPAPAKPVDNGPKVPTSGKPGDWVIQVSALTTRRAAAESVQNLRNKGYDAFLEETAKGLYRVRIGRFKDRAAADRIARRLLKEEGTTSVVQR